MKPLAWKTESPRPTARVDAPPNYREAGAAPATPAINTILAVREHAPAEIDELEGEIQQLHHRLGVAYARKRLLEQLLSVIRAADAENPPSRPGMSVLR